MPAPGQHVTDDRTPREHADGRDPWRWRHGMHQYQHRHQQVGTVRAPVLSRGACRGVVSRETRPAISRSPRLPRPSGAMRGRRPTRLAGRESPSPPRRGEQPFTAVAARTASRRADAAVTVRLPTLLTIRGRMPDTVVRDTQADAERTGATVFGHPPLAIRPRTELGSSVTRRGRRQRTARRRAFAPNAERGPRRARLSPYHRTRSRAHGGTPSRLPRTDRSDSPPPA